jgi:hypothetical protein
MYNFITAALIIDSIKNNKTRDDKVLGALNGISYIMLLISLIMTLRSPYHFINIYLWSAYLLWELVYCSIVTAYLYNKIDNQTIYYLSIAEIVIYSLMIMYIIFLMKKKVIPNSLL